MNNPFASSEVEMPLWTGIISMGVSTFAQRRKFILSAAAGGVEGLDTSGLGKAFFNEGFSCRTA